MNGGFPKGFFPPPGQGQPRPPVDPFAEVRKAAASGHEMVDVVMGRDQWLKLADRLAEPTLSDLKPGAITVDPGPSKAELRLELMKHTPVTFDVVLNQLYSGSTFDLLNDSQRASFFSVWALAARELAEAFITEATNQP